MALFKKKTEKATRKSLELISNQEDTMRLAFGLQWSSIVSTGGKSAAVKMVKARGASHLLYRGQQVGFGYIDQKKTPVPQGVQIFPAAQVVARQYGGDAVHAVKVADGEYWLAVIRNSQPTSVDQYIFASNDSKLIEEATKILEAGSEDGTKYTVFTNLNAHDFGAVTRTSVEDIMHAITQDSEFMEALPSATAVNLPKPVLYALLAAVALGGGQAAWKWKKAKDVAALAAANRPADDLPPDVAWKQAFADWEKDKVAPSTQGFLFARQSLGSIPIIWEGWDLQSAFCKASGAIPDAQTLKRTWSCSATYDRSRIGQFNRDMAPRTPESWAVTFQPLNKMIATWTLSEPAQKIKLSELNTVEYHSLETVSKLQRLTSAFSAAVDVAFTPLVITPPKRNSTGAAYEPEPSLGEYKTSKISLKAPLRTLDVVSQDGVLADWNYVAITTKIGGGIADSAVNQLGKSAIEAEISGVLYAKVR